MDFLLLHIFRVGSKDIDFLPLLAAGDLLRALLEEVDRLANLFYIDDKTKLQIITCLNLRDK